MKAFVRFFSNACGSLSNYVRTKLNKGTRSNEILDKGDFLGDTGRASDVSERERIPTTVDEEPTPAIAESTSSSESSYVAMEEQATNAPMDKAEKVTDENHVELLEVKEEPLPFFWELVRFMKNRSWKKKVMTVLIVSLSLYVVIDLIFFGKILGFMTRFLEWVTEHPFAGVVCFLGILVISTVFFVPPTILYFGAGFAFDEVAGNFWRGFIVATLVCFVGSTLGAILAFLRSRYMMRDIVELFANRFPIVKCLDEAMKTQGFKAMVLLRLCPLIPFNALCHIGGITQISLENYTFAMVGIIPSIILWVLVGATAEQIHNNKADGPEEVVSVSLLIGGVIFAAVAVYLLFRFARDELHNEIINQRALSWHAFPDTSRTHSIALQEAEEGFELINRQPAGLIAVLGIDHHGVDPPIPEGRYDEDWIWIWV